MTIPRFQRLVFKAAFLWAAFFAMATQARAHAFIDHADPVVGGKVKPPPTAVSLWFTETVEARFCRVQVFDASDKEVDKKDLHADPQNPRRLLVSLPAGLAAGTYKVVWRAVSTDTHVTKGDYTFRVEP